VTHVLYVCECAHCVRMHSTQVVVRGGRDGRVTIDCEVKFVINCWCLQLIPLALLDNIVDAGMIV
jgi:hypothetical protein